MLKLTLNNLKDRPCSRNSKKLQKDSRMRLTIDNRCDTSVDTFCEDTGRLWIWC